MNESSTDPVPELDDTKDFGLDLAFSGNGSRLVYSGNIVADVSVPSLGQ